MAIPAFVNLEQDIENRKAFVTVLDKEIKKQREMWGTLSNPMFPIMIFKYLHIIIQVQHAHTSKTTSSESQKVTQLSSASSELDIEQQ